MWCGGRSLAAAQIGNRFNIGQVRAVDHQHVCTIGGQRARSGGEEPLSFETRCLRADGSPAAQRAIDQFTYRVVRESGAMVACMGGLDVLAFSGGIGEHDAQLRAQVCEQLGWMGVRMDAGRNASAPGDAAHAIHAEGSAVQVWVVPTDEGRVAAREAARLLYQEDDAPTPVPLPEAQA